MDIDTGTTTVPFVRYRCSKPGSSPFGGIQLALCAFVQRVLQVWWLFWEEKCGVSKKCGAE